MDKKLTFELLWWAITILVVLLILLPIYNSIGTDYHFYIENIVSIVVFITLARWMFLLRHVFFGWNKKVKLVLIFLMIPLFFICYDNMIDFRSFLDEENIMAMMQSLPTAEQPKMAKYIQYQYIFFGTAAIMTVIMLPFRMVMSIWTQINKGTV